MNIKILMIALIGATTLIAQEVKQPHGDKIGDCQDCHTTEGWQSVRDDYQHPSDFPLSRGHKTNDCKACHSSLVFQEVRSDCTNCHTDVHRGVLSDDCASCHDTAGWENRDNMRHWHAQTQFPLVGVHSEVDCESCHDFGDDWLQLDTTCQACHLADFQGTTNPNHQRADFDADCETCHTPFFADWRADYTHTAAFPLSGGHAGQECVACHQQTYIGTPSDCYSCHAQDYRSAVEPDHVASDFPTDCMSCHQVTSWVPASFDHNLTGFSLTGAHNISDCLACHEQGYTNTSSECISCHRNDYQSTSEPNHAVSGIPETCEDCHSTQAWVPATFDHNQTGFPLTGAHNINDCLACHEQGYNNTSTECISCHQQDYNGTSDPNHVTLGFSNNCEDCHSTQAWAPATFDHNQTGFPLTGSHNISDCLACHEQGYNNTSSECVSCHQQDYNGTSDPNHVRLGFSNNCEDCHNTNAWQPATFDHNQTGFPLTGSHNISDCLACHEQGYNNTSTECVSCHQQDYNGTSDPNHVTLGFSNNCEDCHSTQAWVPATFDHNQTGFPLTGAHNISDCLACHEQGYSNTSTECVSCHQQDYNGTSDPNHVTLGFSNNCEDCHSTQAWEPATFDHNQTGFPLTGAHNINDCLACHEQGYNNTSTECVSCHQQDYNGTSDPNHVTLGFSNNCEECHSTQAWEPATFDHNQTGFPLTGAHNISDCLACHEQGYNNTSSECVSCHQQDYNGTSDPNHVTLGFSNNCEDCHSTQAWEPATFDHNQTGFPLTGAHNIDDCLACHEQGYSNTSTECISCHQQDYNGTSDPNHVTLGFSNNCEDCHNTTAWQPATFDHNQTGFPLTGAHNISDCLACHEQGYNNTSTECVSCHQQDYNGTSDPNHVTLGFSSNCEDCHNTNAWQPATFDHNQTGFPLTGAHNIDDCLACHEQGYSNTSTECVSCHQQDYNGTRDPNHVTLGFSNNCEDCHSTQAWEPATFDHNQTGFPLTFGHNITDCLACHSDGYANTPTDCYACHAEDYNGADPNHVSAGFPTDCTQCHNTRDWDDANFNHSFPIFNGSHRGEWDTCADCHVIPNQFQAFECINCHEHNRNEMDDEHRGISGYSYDSQACYSCHPNGEED